MSGVPQTGSRQALPLSASWRFTPILTAVVVLDEKGCDYILTIPYGTDEDLRETIIDLLGETSSVADGHHCFIEDDISAVGDLDRRLY